MRTTFAFLFWLFVVLVPFNVLKAQPTISTLPAVVPGTNFGGVTFNLSTNQAIVLDSLYCVFNSVTAGTSTLNGYSIWYRTTPISSAPTITSPTWILLDTFTLVPANTAANGSIVQAIPKSLGLVIPPNSTYGFFIGNFTIEGGITYGSTAPGGNTTPTYTDGFVTIATGQNITFGGRGPTPTLTPRYFAGGVRYRFADRAPNDAGITSINAPVNFCPNTLQDVNVTLRNFGRSQLNSVLINWSVNGLPQSPFAFTGVLDTTGGAASDDTTLTIGSFLFGNTPSVVQVYTSLPNGAVDTVNNNDTARISVSPALFGIFTVGGAGAAFPTLDSAIAAINTGGLCGNTELHITGNVTVTNPLVIQDNLSGFSLLIKPVGGAFTIDGNVSGALLRLAGCDNVTIDGDNGGQSGGLTFRNNSTATNSAAIHISNASNGTGCRNIQLKKLILEGGSTTVTSAFAVSVSGPTISTSSTGGGHGNLLFENNIFRNSYFGLYARGPLTSVIDSLVVRNNVFGSSTTANTISFRGLDIQGALNPLVEGNLFQNITIGTTVSIGAMDIGTNVTAARIERNVVRNIVQTNTSGGAYGISVTGGTDFTLLNNVITGVRANNALNTSLVTNAFGIRISSGTGHKLYYNSVNMHGAYTNTSATAMATAALVVASTAITGLDIRNNIFANSITAVTTGAKSNVAVWFPANYNFAGNTIDHNAYFVTPNSSSHGVGRIGTTSGGGVSTDLVAWRLVSQNGNPTNDVNSQPVANALPPFTSNDTLTIPVATNTPAESGGTVISALGVPNVDFTGLNRPAFGGTAPDIGAYEFDGVTGDFITPLIDSVFFTPDTGVCTAIPRLVTAIIRDPSGIDTAQILYSTNGVVQTPILMTPGTLLNSYTATIPALGNAGVTFRIRAVDSSPNRNAIIGAEREYQDEYLSAGLVTSTPTPAVVVGDSVTLNVSSPALGSVKITEVVLFRTGTGATSPYPSFIPTSGNDDLVEITNISSSPADISGFTFEVLGTGPRTFTFPAGTVIPGNQVVVLHIGSGTNVPSSLFFNTGGSNNSWLTGNPIGLVLKSQAGFVIDAVALNAFTFPASSGVTSQNWSGTGAPSPSGPAGTQLLGADLNNSTNWTPTSATSLGTIGSINAGLVFTSSLSISWSYLGLPIGTGPFVRFGPLNTLGTNTFDVTVTDGTCTTTATLNVNVAVNVGFSDNNILSDISIFPNPVQDLLIVQLDQQGEGKLTITDVTGKVAYFELVRSDQDKVTVDVSGLNAGMYFVYYDTEGKRITKRVVKY